MERRYSDSEHIEIAREEYSDYKTQDPFVFDNDNGEEETIGYISDILGKMKGLEFSKENAQRMKENMQGLNGYVVTDKKVGGAVTNEDIQQVTVLYQGSKAEVKDPLGTANDWVNTDLKQAARIKTSQWTGGLLNGEKAQQLEYAAQALKATLKKYPNARVTIYGHSLGSMNAQAALAELTEEELERIDGAYIYEGPNIYPNLTDDEKARIDKVRHKIYNYIDTKDVVSMGYPDEGSEGAVGTVVRVDSKNVSSIVSQHMWGGYQFNADGSIQVIEADRQSIRLAKLKNSQDDLKRRFGLLKKRYEQIKAGGYTRPETVYIDSQQATLLANQLEKDAEISLGDVKNYCDEAIQEAQNNWKQLIFSAQNWSLTESFFISRYGCRGDAGRSGGHPADN